ncbi:DNA-binding transcriptional regulator, MarR family [Celeribacter neptunius]|uniref:DNA-binding transcriptional regulator, MarR family n=2 Tax=Celeribacter neptunius TaxID=588602 RepID=A0A1I3S631_9RHOB|nr:DNA-binding transcriptional regulator, MarR family [Celeribacter neptunius]
MQSVEFDLSAFLPYRLAVLSERASRRVSVAYDKPLGLSVAEWRVLVHLNRCERVSVREIHNCVNLEKSRVSRAVTRLENAGLVAKVPGASDGRLVEISLSAKGVEALDSILPEAMQVERALLETISPEELAMFYAVMEKMHAALDEDPLARPRSAMDLQGIDT